MDDIIIYTTPKKLAHKRDLLTEEEDDDKSNNGTYYWRLSRLPKSWDVEQMNNVEIRKEVIKMYFAAEGFVKGYFEVDGIDWDDCGFDIEFKSSSWKDITPIPITHFQGFKYAYKVEGLNQNDINRK